MIVWLLPRGMYVNCYKNTMWMNVCQESCTFIAIILLVNNGTTCIVSVCSYKEHNEGMQVFTIIYIFTKRGFF